MNSCPQAEGYTFRSNSEYYRLDRAMVQPHTAGRLGRRRPQAQQGTRKGGVGSAKKGWVGSGSCGRIGESLPRSHLGPKAPPSLTFLTPPLAISQERVPRQI